MRRFLPALAVVLAVSACSSEGSEGPEPLPDDTILLWTSTAIEARTPDGERWEIDTDDQLVSQVTPSPGEVMAWTSIDPTSGASRTALAGIRGEDGVTVQVPTAPFFYAWSPDSANLAFTGNDTDRAGVMVGVLEISSNTASRLQTGAPFFVDWSPGGERLVAHVGSSWLGYIDIPSGSASQIDRAAGGFPAPAWLPSGVLVVVEQSASAQPGQIDVALQGPSTALALVDPQTNQVREVAPVTGVVRFFPDRAGTKVAVVERSSTTSRLRLLSLPDGSEIDRFEGGIFELAQWSPDGSRLLFTQRSDVVDPLIPKVWADGEISEYADYIPSVTFARDYVQFWDQFDRSISLWSASGTAFVLPSADDDGDFVRIEHLGGDTERHDGFSMGIWAR